MKNITVYGNLAKDCDKRNTPQGMDVVNFDIACNDPRTKEVYWFSCAYWGKGGAGVAPYLKKGQPVVVSGEFSWREYNDKKYLEINVNALTLAGKGKDNGYQQEEQSTYGEQSPPAHLDDEIPF